MGNSNSKYSYEAILGGYLNRYYDTSISNTPFPKDLSNLIYSYLWGFTEYQDRWCTNTTNCHFKIDTKRNTIETKGYWSNLHDKNFYRFAFGTLRVSKGMIVKWSIKIIKSNCKYRLLFGIIDERDIPIDANLDIKGGKTLSMNWPITGYLFDSSNGNFICSETCDELLNTGRPAFHWQLDKSRRYHVHQYGYYDTANDITLTGGKYGEPWGEKNDIITMILDMRALNNEETGTLSFEVNNITQGADANGDVSTRLSINKTYRIMFGCRKAGQKIKILGK